MSMFVYLLLLVLGRVSTLLRMHDYGMVPSHLRRIIKAIYLYKLLLVSSNHMSESESEFYGLLRHIYTVDVHFYLFTVGFRKCRIIYGRILK